MMKWQVQVEAGKIVEAKFKTVGCDSAIASGSWATEWITGKSVDDAMKIKNTDIAKELGLAPSKLHCSMLAQDGVLAALNDAARQSLVRQTRSRNKKDKKKEVKCHIRSELARDS